VWLASPAEMSSVDGPQQLAVTIRVSDQKTLSFPASFVSSPGPALINYLGYPAKSGPLLTERSSQQSDTITLTFMSRQSTHSRVRKASWPTSMLSQLYIAANQETRPRSRIRIPLRFFLCEGPQYITRYPC